jgi:hypothetical protein
MPIPVPPHPGEAPSVDAPADRWSRYLKLLEMHQAALIANQRSEDQKAAADSQHAMAAAMLEIHRAPPRLPTRRQMVLDHFSRMPQLTGITDLQAVDISTAAVDAFLKRFPAEGAL